MRNTIPKYSAFLFLISIVILFSCRKLDAFKNKEVPEEVFSVAAAKEWFYGKFKKSASYSEEVESIFSLHTVAVTARRKQYRKYPLWNQAVAYRNGNMTVVEAPLFVEANTILLPGMQAATAAERKRVAAATLHKVVFVQTGTQQMDVRIISIIPKLEYLQAHSYDISNNTARSVAPDFEGFYVVRGWNNSVYRFLEVKQGKIVRSVTIVTTGSRVAAQRTSHTDLAAAMQNSSGMCGEWVWVPYLQRVCVRTALCEGDIPCPELPCEEWEEIEMYRLEFQVDPDCVGGGGPGGGGTGDPFGDCLLTGTDYNTCLCWVWGICEGGGGGGGAGDLPGDGDPCAEVQSAANSTTSLSQNSSFLGAKSNIQNANPNVEHSVVFGTDANGNITASPMTSCTSPSTCSVNSSWPGAFADLHNHPNNLPPSAGDLYNLIGINNNHITFNTRMVTVNNSTIIYALVVLDLNKANHFIGQKPPVQSSNGPDFNDEITDIIIDIVSSLQFQGYSKLIAEEMALAFILNEYNTGLALLKTNTDGVFVRLNTKRIQSGSNVSYTSDNCN